MIVSFASSLSRDKHPFILLPRQLYTTPFIRLVTRLLFNHKCGCSYTASLTTKIQPAFVANHKIVMENQSLAVQFLDICSSPVQQQVSHCFLEQQQNNHHHLIFYHPKKQNRLNIKLKKKTQKIKKTHRDNNAFQTQIKFYYAAKTAEQTDANYCFPVWRDSKPT